MPFDTSDTREMREASEAAQEWSAATRRLSATGIRAMQGEVDAPAPGKWVDRSVQDVPVADLPEAERIEDRGDFKKGSDVGQDKRDLSREEMRQLRGHDLSSREKGEIGERALLKENERLGRQMIAHHVDNPNASGLDGVAWDPKERKLYLQEAKNYQPGSTVGENNLSAFKEGHWEANIDSVREAIWNSDLSKGNKIAALADLRNRKFVIELAVSKGVDVSDSALELLAEKGGDVVVKQFDGRLLWSQERKVVGRTIS